MRPRNGRSIDLGLQVAATAFVDALEPLLASVRRAAAGGDARDRPGTTTEDVRTELAREAEALALAFIAVDRRITDDELWAYLVAFAPLLDPQLIRETPESLRARRITEGRTDVLDRLPSAFEELVVADRRDGTTWASTYYEHAVALGFMTASLDDHTSGEEINAIERFRSALLAAIRTGTRPDGTMIGEPATPAVGDAAAGGATGAPPSGIDGDAGLARPPAAAGTKAAAPTAEPGDEAADEPPRPIDELLAELDELVGLQAVKDRIKLVTNLLRVQKLRAERGLRTQEQSHHLVFTGNPGTGKTTVARLVAQIYRTLGVVERGHLIETDRSGLVAGFVGQTATKVVDAFDRAEQGVLLIDEAYALVRGSDGDFGREAIDTIVKLVEDRRDRVVVIVAGYPAEMAELIGANPGLTSRFPTTIEFPDYGDDELVRIFRSMCDRNQYLLDADAERRVRTWLAAQPRGKGFGNARVVRNLFETVVARQAGRVVAIEDPSDVDLVLLRPDDIPDAPPGGAAPDPAA